jgi:hypothetical protein
LDQQALKLFGLGILVPIDITLSVYQSAGPATWDDNEGRTENALVPGNLDIIKFTAFGEGFCRSLGSI